MRRISECQLRSHDYGTDYTSGIVQYHRRRYRTRGINPADGCPSRPIKSTPWGGGYLGYIAKPVVDSTGLKGAHDFDLKWTPTLLLEHAGIGGITIFDAVDKELGLKLALGTAPRTVLIVDSIDESPTPNPPDLAKQIPPLPQPQFEVATIKPSKPDEKQMFAMRGDTQRARHDSQDID